MSEQKQPEVGDVWYIAGARIYITCVHNGFIDTMRFCFKDCYRDKGYTITELLQDGKYLGKSKANINELFEVCDDKNN